MSNFFTKNKYFFGLFLCLIGLYFLLRLPSLTLQPIFADEAIYIRWAQVMKAEPTLRFLPLSDGKTPLFMWAMTPFFKFFEDPLYAGRLLSVLSGFLTFLGVVGLSYYLFGVLTALLAGLFYVVTPFIIFFDRMALADSMLAATTVWALFLAVLVVKKQRMDLAMVLGYILGIGILVKTPAMVNLLVLPFTILGFNFPKNKSDLLGSKRYELVKLFLCWVVAFIIALVIYNILRLGPGFYQLSKRNSDYIFSYLEILQHPFDPLIPHLKDISTLFPVLLSPGIVMLLFVGIFYMFKNKNRSLGTVFLWSIIPMLILLVFLKTLTARYLLFTIPPLLIVSAYGMSQLIKFKKIIAVVIFLFILPYVAYFDFLLLTSPEKAPLPQWERRGYLEDWTAGYHLKDISQLLIEENKKQQVVLGTEGYFGTFPEGIQIYLDKEKIPVVGGGATISAQLRESAKENKTYFLVNKSRVATQPEKTKLIKEYLKAEPLDPRFPQDAILLYEVFP